MPTKIVDIAGVGPVVLAKRKGNRHLRLSVTGAGVVRVSMPYWAPYSAGTAFAKSRVDWIRKQLAHSSLPLIGHGARIGNRLTVQVERTQNAAFASRTYDNYLVVKLPEPHNLEHWQSAIREAAERALKKTAEAVLPPRLRLLADRYGYDYKELKIRKMSSRWGSCSSKKTITLSYYLVQLPPDLIDFVLIHELLHTRHMHHGHKFWEEFERILPNAAAARKQMREHKPRLTVSAGI